MESSPKPDASTTASWQWQRQRLPQNIQRRRDVQCRRRPHRRHVAHLLRGRSSRLMLLLPLP